MKTKCAYCNKEIDRPKFRVAKGRCYCNAKCQMGYEYNNGIRDKKLTVEHAQEMVRQKALKRFLSGNPTIKIGKRGYLMIYIPKLYDSYYKKGWIPYHHYIYCTTNKTKIADGYCVHHKDGNRLNNNIENLEYMSVEQHNNIPRNRNIKN